MTTVCGFALWCCALTFYPAVRQQFIGATGADASQVVALSYLTGCVLLILLVLRSRPPTLAALHDAIRAAGVLLAIVMLAQIAGWYGGWASFEAGELSPSDELRSASDRDASAGRPDVYHVILDGFGRPDVLQAMYGLDLSGTVRALKERGFDVAEENGSANYTQTYLSLASMLNVRYLDSLAEQFPKAHSRAPLHRLIQRSSVIEAFKRLGYQIHFVGSIYSATQRHRLADVCDCDYPLVAEFESTVIHGTPFGDIGFSGFDYRPHRNKLRRSLETLETLPPPPTRPRFLLAHMTAPHPPFVYDSDGQEIHPPRAFSFYDGSMYRGNLAEYASGYSGQTRYIAARLLVALDRFEQISRERGRNMVVIVHGDHGPRAHFSAVDAGKTDPTESLPVLLAIRWSGPEYRHVRVTSLVNIYRAFFRRYFNVELELLPDRAFVSSFLTPYLFVEVDPGQLSK